MMTADDILEDEFTRAPIPGLREFSVGVLKLARKLRVVSTLAAGQATAEEQQPAHLEQDEVIIPWLLDERNSELQIREAADAGRAALLPVLDAYVMTLSPALMAGAKLQIERANLALAKMMFRIAPKPSKGEPETPPGKS